ncbi:hypothetical protein D3C79_698870 [compost metagenome]
MLRVGFLDQWCEACTRADAQRLAIITGLHLGFSEYPGGPFGCLLGARPGLADRAILAARTDGRGVLDRTVVQQVVARFDHVRGHSDRRLAIATSFLPADPADTVVAIVRFGVFHRHHGIPVGLLQVVLHFLVLCQRSPTGLVHLVRHSGRHRLAGEL